ncbi:DNA-directed RNA polymerase subunit omega [uncultured Proteiniphilum sp.]|uniref:DNA-directed RNA polymerase subunit omega n=1 Tax=uncultured Proteiniphilum sp. TaxID=497637 RepID=UPI0026243534|nr:DNA-directed RNA polymerase subunit omega [uncultured Proteiniphilum sp.]
MDYKKIAASTNTETRDVMKMSEPVGNVYEMVMIIGKRANQLAIEMKQDLDAKLQEFASYSDNLEEVFENHEQIEISRFYEKLPKPSLLAIEEWKDADIYYRNPSKEKEMFG